MSRGNWAFTSEHWQTCTDSVAAPTLTNGGAVGQWSAGAVDSWASHAAWRLRGGTVGPCYVPSSMHHCLLPLPRPIFHVSCIVDLPCASAMCMGKWTWASERGGQVSMGASEHGGQVGMGASGKGQVGMGGKRAWAGGQVSTGARTWPSGHGQMVMDKYAWRGGRIVIAFRSLGWQEAHTDCACAQGNCALANVHWGKGLANMHWQLGTGK